MGVRVFAAAGTNDAVGHCVFVRCGAIKKEVSMNNMSSTEGLRVKI